MKLITISGLDGSGKSTQVELLKNYLENQGKRVYYFHAIQFGLANLLKNKYYTIFRSKDSVIKEKSVISANKIQIALRKMLLQIDIWRFKILLNQLLNKKYDYVLSDRYFYDSVVNIAFLRMCHSGPDPESAKVLKQVQDDKIRKPDMAFYLQVAPELIMQRDRKPDQGLEYLRKKKELYNKYSVSWDMKIIDGNQNKEAIFENIKNLIS